MPPSTRDSTGREPTDPDDGLDSDDPVPLRVGGPCPRCGAVVEDLDYLSLPPVAIKREMYDVCVLDTDDLPTPWRHRTAVAYHEDPDPAAGTADPAADATGRTPTSGDD